MNIISSRIVDSRSVILRRQLERNGSESELAFELEQHRLPLPIVAEHAMILVGEGSYDWSTTK